MHAYIWYAVQMEFRRVHAAIRSTVQWYIHKGNCKAGIGVVVVRGHRLLHWAWLLGESFMSSVPAPRVLPSGRCQVKL